MRRFAFVPVLAGIGMSCIYCQYQCFFNFESGSLASETLGVQKKWRFQGPTPYLLNQNLKGWTCETTVNQASQEILMIITFWEQLACTLNVRTNIESKEITLLRYHFIKICYTCWFHRIKIIFVSLKFLSHDFQLYIYQFLSWTFENLLSFLFSLETLL